MYTEINENYRGIFRKINGYEIMQALMRITEEGYSASGL